MKTSIISATAAFALLPAFTAAGPMTTRQTADDLLGAVQAWHDDTGAVSNFLNVAAAGIITDNTDFMGAAAQAHGSEVDELTHKAVLDNFLAPFAVESIITANTTLVTDGNFQFVVDSLQTISEQGFAALFLVDQINAIRCGNVLPAIDAYFAEIAATEGTDALTAVRPFACQ